MLGRIIVVRRGSPGVLWTIEMSAQFNNENPIQCHFAKHQFLLINVKWGTKFFWLTYILNCKESTLASRIFMPTKYQDSIFF
jgi:hypothetical protein